MPHVGDYELLASGGQYNGNSSTMRIYLYPNGSAEVDECTGLIKNAQVDMAEQLVSAGKISYYRIYLSSDRPGLGYIFRDDYYDGFDTWVKNNNYDANIGSHLGVKNSFGGGLGYNPESYGSAFTTGLPAVLGTDSSDDQIRQGAIHEVLHNYIRADLVQDMTTSLTATHELGQIYSHNDLVSPFATGYSNGTDSPASRGDCSSNNWWANGTTTTLTQCTKTGIGRTANDEV